MFIDAANYSENDTPANAGVPPLGGLRQATARALNADRGISTFGRVTTPYPLSDGSNRVLLAYRPCEVTKNGLRIAPSGAVVDCSIVASGLQAGTLVHKLLARARQFDFGAEDVDVMVVSWPVEFQPS